MSSRSFQHSNFDTDKELCRQLAGKMNVPYEIASLLVRKGVESEEEASAYLYPQLANLPSPQLMKDMDRAIDLVVQNYLEQGRILIHGDYDVDGISGTALLSLFFNSIGIASVSFQPNRLTEGYGLQKRIIEQHRPGDSKSMLLITVDCGISSHEEVLYAREAGYKVIITDHHEPPETLPPAEAILNPKQHGCRFPYDQLAGVGVAFFLAVGIRSRMVEQGLIPRETAPKLKELLSLVAMGTVADVMPLTGINRTLVRAGLEVISQRATPWIWALCDQAGLREGPVTAEDISFRLAPRINAPGRLGSPEAAFQFLTSPDTVRAIELAKQLEKINQDRRQLELDIIDEVYKECTLQDKTGSRGLVVYGRYHPGIIGVVASRVVDRFNKPVVILTDDAASGEILKGSGRSVELVDLYKTLLSCSDTLVQFGGHAMAAGLTLKKENLSDFVRMFNAVLPEITDVQSTAEDEGPSADMIIDGDDFFDSRFIHYYQLMEPFGNGNHEPVFLLPNFQLHRVSVVSNHLKYSLRMINGTIFKGIGFGMADKLKLVQDKPVDFYFKIKKNVFRGEEYIELHAVDITIPAIQMKTGVDFT